MTRYFVEIAYNGTRLSGWQRQLNAPSVQAKIEDACRVILREPTFEILGCGRTDAGVHATKYIAHFDFEGVFPKSFLQRANKVVGNDIYIKQLYEVPQTAHARFDAVSRSYEYHLSYNKNPFAQETEWCFPKISPLDTSLMQKRLNY